MFIIFVMAASYNVLIIEPDERMRGIIDLYLLEAPEWTAIESNTTRVSPHNLENQLQKIKDTPIDAVLFDGNYTDGRRFDGTIIVENEERFALARHNAHIVHRLLPKAALVGFGLDARKMEDVLERAGVKLDANVDTDFRELPAVLGKIAAKLDKRIAA